MSLVEDYIYIIDRSSPDVIFKVDVSEGWGNFVIEDKWTGPSGDWEGTWESLAGDEDYLYVAMGKNDVAECRVYKIKKSDMTTVTYYTYAGNGYDWNCLQRIGDYLYLGLGSGYYTPKIQPRVIKIDKESMTYVDEIVIPDTDTNSSGANLYIDSTDSNILWVGSNKQSVGPPFDPIVTKINLSTFTVETYRTYTSADFGSTSGCSLPYFLQDSMYLYTFFKRGARVKIRKSDLSFTYFRSAEDYSWYPSRYMYLRSGKIYVVHSCYSCAIVRYSAGNLTIDYYRYLFDPDGDDEYPEDYDTYATGLIMLDDIYPDMWVLDMGTSRPWTKQIIKVKDTGAKFIIRDVWTNTDSDAYKPYTWFIQEAEVEEDLCESLTCEAGTGIVLGGFLFEHVLDYNETMSRPIPRKSVLGKCSPTPEATSFITNPRTIVIRARLNSAEKKEIWDLHKDCEWKLLCIDGVKVDCVWLARPRFRWDSDLGCGPESRPWIANIKLICRTT